MLYAHYFEGRQAKQVVFTTSASLNGMPEGIQTVNVSGKREARKLADSLNAKRWNF